MWVTLLGEKYGKERVTLCRHDGLAYLENLTVPEAEKIMKDAVEILTQQFNLSITSLKKFKIVNFFRCNLNLG